MFWSTRIYDESSLFLPHLLEFVCAAYDLNETERGRWCSQTLRKGNGGMIACRGFGNFLNHT
ncbi:hypothetical protein GIB67_022648 [Kingdonia uniflora]|uniref:Uncharacterized protein n=1 Tax=Kingdonia uniflora TaxID=39325 RepID=A0A7J7P894_9MAGN|nr:hypothetical protein GIB67_022648 [Kingdonia uniflora]